MAGQAAQDQSADRCSALQKDAAEGYWWTMKHYVNSQDDVDASTPEAAELQQGLDYYVENGLFVFTATFLLKRGYCCESGCRHCPYDYTGKRTEE